MLVAERRDSLGRKIGYNWWREYNARMVRDHNDAVAAIEGTNHQMEPDEFRSTYPLLTLKECLIRNAS